MILQPPVAGRACRSSSRGAKRMRVYLAVLILALAASSDVLAQKKLICLTQAVGFEHDVVKEKDGQPSIVNATMNKLAESLGMEYEHTRDASILTPEKLKDTQVLVFYTTGTQDKHLPMK